MTELLSRALLVRALVLGALLLSAWWLLNSPVFAFGGVQVDGYDGADKTQLEVALRNAAGEGNLFQLPRDEIKSAAGRFPEVGDVAVTRQWPRSLRITVIPARPVAALVSQKGQSKLVSAQGRVIGPAPAKHRLPRLFMAGPTPKAGSSVPKGVAPALAFVRELPPEVASRVRALRLAKNTRLEGRIAGSGLLIVGRPERPRARAAALTAVINNLSDEDQAAARYVDITVPERPAVGFGDPSSTVAGDDP